MSDRARYWFSAKKFGFGWRAPITWEGWAVDVIALTMLVAAGLWIHGHRQQHPMLQLGFLFVVLATSLAIRHWKGEPQSWG
jgi:hypothetical protein